ncbi:ribosomal RNA small subunit methyltransferase G [Prevotella sp. CAG:924]|nr:ribosomal RNA small subunit methyltransferase G [Prevotella sp. CAG:924]
MTAKNIVYKYFTQLTDTQQKQIDQLDELYRDWNAKINVISRKDIDGLYLHHVLHSMALSRILRFKPGTRILDFGTGGGFPGIPLAILFPECQFRLIDGTGKKIKVAQAVADAIGLKNVEAVHRRGEEEKDKFDFIVSRAVMPLPDLVKIVRKNIAREQHNALANGLLVLKGGDLKEEIRPFKNIVELTPLSDYFEEEWFQEKYAIYLPL